jgi:hypothetical protein
LELYEDTVRKNKIFNRINELYKIGVLRDKEKLDDYLAGQMLGVAALAGILTALVYIPVDFIMQAQLFEKTNLGNIKNLVFQNSDLFWNRCYIIMWTNLFRFTFQYGFIFMISELYTHQNINNKK